MCITLARVSLLALIAFLLPTCAQREHATAMMVRGDNAFNEGDYDTALDNYKNVLRTFPGEPNALLRIAAIDLYANDAGDAANILNGLAFRYPKDDDISALQAAVQNRLQQYAGTQMYYRVSKESRCIPFRSLQGAPIVSVTLNHSTYDFMVDTGTTDIILNDWLARALSLPRVGQHLAYSLGTNADVLPMVSLKNFTVGNVNVSLARAFVKHLAVPDSAKVHLAGLLGVSFLFHMVTTLDFRHECVRFQQRTSGANPDVVRHRTSAPLWLLSDGSMTTNGAVNGVAAAISPDTGFTPYSFMPSTLLAESLAHTMKYDAASRFSEGNVVSANIAIGTASEHDARGLVLPIGLDRPLPPRSAVFGVPFFQRYIVTLDFSRMRIVLGW